MNEQEYAAQRGAGAEQIIAKLRELAKEQGIEIDAATWAHGAPNVDHALTISADGRMAIATFADEQLADYPGRVGTARTDAMLRELVQQLTRQTRHA
jgi:hypothetical protein